MASSTSTKVKTFNRNEAFTLLEDVDVLYSGKGKNVTIVDLAKQKPDKAELVRLMLGPTGNLRAPTFRIGRTLMVGFHEETYRMLLT